MNDKLSEIQGIGINSLTDIYEKLESIQGTGLFNSISDIHDSLDK